MIFQQWFLLLLASPLLTAFPASTVKRTVASDSSYNNRLEWENDIAATWRWVQHVEPAASRYMQFLGIMLEDVDGLDPAEGDSAIVTIIARDVVTAQIYITSHYNTEGFRMDDYEPQDWEREHPIFEWTPEPALTVADAIALIRPSAHAAGRGEPLTCIISNAFAGTDSGVHFLFRYDLMNNFPAAGAFGIVVNPRTRAVAVHLVLAEQDEEYWTVPFPSAAKAGNATQFTSPQKGTNSSSVLAI